MIEKFFKLLDKICYVLCAVFLSGMVLTIFSQVITRTLQISLPWSTEVSKYMFVWVTFIAAYLGARKGRHIGVEIIQSRVPKFVRKIMQFMSWILASFYFGLVFVYCVKLWPMLGIQTSPILKWPMNFIYLGMMFGLLALSLYYFYFALLQLFPKLNKEIKEV